MAAPPPSAKIAAVVVAAGKGLRAGQSMPKQFARWRGKPVIRHSVEALSRAGIAPIAVVIPEGADGIANEALAGLDTLLVTGADTRQGSVARGLAALGDAAPDRVLIHDAARPILPQAVLERLICALDRHKAAIPVLPIADSLLVAEADTMAAHADREALRRVQTPQAFSFDAIIRAHEAWDGPPDAGDDAQVARQAGITVALVDGDESLHKLTFAHDFSGDEPAVRVGTGYDVHRLAEGEDLWLAGVRIDHDKGLAGHSDADVAIHAVVDAMLGALGAGDIGSHFPPSDPQWKGARSAQFLEHAAMLAAEAGYGLGNLDLTIICEAPKIGPHRGAMRERLAAILAVDSGRVSVKATTTERLGFTGREEGIAAQAIVSLFKL